MSTFASLMAVTRLSADDIGHVVSQAIKGQYWPCLSLRLVNSLMPTVAIWVTDINILCQTGLSRDL